MAPGGRPDRARSAASGRGALDEEALAAFEARHPEGLTSSQIVEALEAAGHPVSEATFRKWVQIGLLPRSIRVGRKGKHQGSLGLYPPSTLRMIAAIRRQMESGQTAQEIASSRRLKADSEALERGARALMAAFAEQLAASTSLGPGDRRTAEKQLEQLEKQWVELFRRIGILERRIVEPLEREARARAFGSGTSGGAGDLL
jgi:hypothetical protein